MTEDMWSDLVRALGQDRESAGIISARIVEDESGTTLLARQLEWAPDDSYLERDADGLILTSGGWVPAARAAIRDEGAVIFIHSHPDGPPLFSRRDDRVDEELFDAVQKMDGGSRYVALLIAGTEEKPLVAARIYGRDSSDVREIEKFRIIGSGIQVQLASESGGRDLEAFDRQIRAFGAKGQLVLHALHVGVVGAGGTGSAVAEQLARLGVGHLTIVDDDVVTAATPTRGYGIAVADMGSAKSEVLSRHLRAVGLGTSVDAIVGAVQGREARTALRHADLIFSCVDGHGARLVLNRWAYAHLAPVIDIGILLSSNAGVLAGIDGRITWLSPGTACLLCRGRLDPALAYSEMLDPIERQRLAGEGYAPEVGTPQPAVVTLTSLVASLATTELLLRLFDLADTEATEILARVQDRELRKNCVPPREECFCSSRAFIARGLAEPHLDLMWPK